MYQLNLPSISSTVRPEVLLDGVERIRSLLSDINLPAKWLINAVGPKGGEQNGGGIEIPDAGALIAFALRKCWSRQSCVSANGNRHKHDRS